MAKSVNVMEEELRQAFADYSKDYQELTNLASQKQSEILTIENRYAPIMNTAQISLKQNETMLKNMAKKYIFDLIKEKKKKTIVIGGNLLILRLNPLALRTIKIANVLAALVKFRLHRYIRTKREINKEAILNDLLHGSTKTIEQIKKIPDLSATKEEELLIKAVFVPKPLVIKLKKWSVL